ncbi:MAG: MG2 domain-containing protein [Bacteroidales bacterium]
MKRIPVVAVTTILTCTTHVAESQTLQRVEIKSPVERADSQDLPQTTIRLANEEYQRAKLNGDNISMLRSTFLRLHAEQRIGEKESEWFSKELSKVTSQLTNPAVKAIAKITSLINSSKDGVIDSMMFISTIESINNIPTERSSNYSDLIELNKINLEVAPNIKQYLLYTLAGLIKEDNQKSANLCYEYLLEADTQGSYSMMITELLKSDNYEYKNLKGLYLKYSHLAQSSQILELMASINYSLSNDQRNELMEFAKGNEAIRKYLINQGLSINIPKQLYPNRLAEAKVTSRDLVAFGINISVDNKVMESKYTLKMNDYPDSNEQYVNISAPSIGKYSGEVLLNSLKGNSNQSPFEFSVSKIATAYLSEPQKLRVFAVDLITGRPLKRASLHNIRYDKKVASTPLPIIDGITTIENQNVTGQYRVTSGSDSLMPLSNIYHYNYPERQASNKQIQLTTDRPIYQPGDIIHIKGVIWQEIADNLQANSNESIEITIKSPNGKDIYNQKVTSNKFGSIYCNTVIPKSGMNGIYNIILRNSNGIYANQSFKVEAYKTPTLLITIDKPTVGYSLENSFEVIGDAKSFSGLPIANTNVKYKVELFESWWRFFYPNKRYSVEYSGEGVTDNIGRFSIPIDPQRLNYDQSKKIGRLSLKITAFITDNKGETKENSITLPLSKEAILIECNTEQYHEKSKLLSLRPEFKTAQGAATKGEGRYEFKRKSDNISISSGNFNAWSNININTNSLSNGIYTLEIAATGELSSDTLSRDILIYDIKSNKMPIDTTSILIPIKEECLVGEKASFLFGSSLDKIWVRYTHFIGKETHEEKWIELSKGLHHFEVDTKEANNDSKVLLFFVKDGKFYREEFNASVTKPIDSLDIKLTTFRDKLRPGENESWSVEISSKAGKHPKCELAAWMYDAALDQLIGNRTDIYQPTLLKKSKYYSLQQGESFSTSEINIWPWSQLNLHERFSSGLKLYGYYPGSTPEIVLYSSATKSPRLGGMVEENDMSAARGKESALLTNGMTISEVREKFNQTAFFFPSINPDTAGRAKIDFTLPEAVTTWKLKLLAHTEDMRIAKLEKEIVAQKEMMIEPNLPRFIRQGDYISINSKLSFISSEREPTTVTLELFDPITNQVWHKESSLIENPSSSNLISFKLDVPKERTATGVRITAQNSKFSDGEQHVISILPDRDYLTESNTIRANAGSSNTLSMDIYDGEYTIEIVKNPTWYAVQALSAISDSNSPNAVSIASNLIANAVGSSLAQSNPSIRSYIESGQTEQLLKRNNKLKIDNIDNTLWVEASQREADQINSMIKLFDSNLMSTLRLESLEKMIALQSTDGGFAWCPGMNSSTWQTAQVLYLLGMLPEYGEVEFTQEEKMMLIRAVAFLDKEIIRISNEEDKARVKATAINSLQLIILQARSLYRDIPLTAESLTRHKEWMERAKNSWAKESIDRKVAIANLMFDYGFSETAQSITESIYQYGVKSNEYGFYFPSNRADRIKTHVGAMRLFARAQVAKMQIVEDMKLWLLANKRNRVWETTPETVEAVYALLNSGKNLLESNHEVTLHLGNKVIESGDKNYFITNLNREEISKEKGKFKLTNNSNSPAYATVYRQWLAPYSSLKDSKKSNLQVIKEIVTTTDSLAIGSKVKVRLTVISNQSVDYVMLTDTYAGCFEPVSSDSKYIFNRGVGAYQEQRSGDIRFFIEHLPKGTHSFEYEVWIDRKGNYSTGVAKVQSLYNPELVNHSVSSTIIVD